MSLAGIDFSTHFVDVVLLDEDTDAATWHRFELSGADAFDRARDVWRKVPRAVASFWDEVVAVGIEQPRGNFGVTHMMRIQGAVLACIPSWKLVHPLNPSDWRKRCGMPGNCPKDQVEAFATFHRGVEPFSDHEFWPQDACDAYAIAWATRTLLQHGVAA